MDAEEQMRAALDKFKDHCALLEPLDIQTTFRIIVEVDEDSTPGLDNEQRGKDIPILHRMVAIPVQTTTYSSKRSRNREKLNSVYENRAVIVLPRPCSAAESM